MKKNVFICLLLILLSAVCILFIALDKRNVQFCVDANNTPGIEIGEANYKVVIKPYFSNNDSKYYFFLPSFISGNSIYFDKKEAAESITIDGQKYGWFSFFEWKEDEAYELNCNDLSYHVVFMKSANIPSIFLLTDSGTMDNINSDKEVVESGAIVDYSATGNVEYYGKLKAIQGRGTSTWIAPKKSYKFSLKAKAKLCGLEPEDKWNLLSMYYENDRMRSKITFDMENYLDTPCAVNNSYVDVYANGTYLGLYLLTDRYGKYEDGNGSVDLVTLNAEMIGDVVEYDLSWKHDDLPYYRNYSCFNSPSEISGDYLLELIPSERLSYEEPCFQDGRGYSWRFKTPDNINLDEIEYIHDYLQKIYDLMQDEGTYWDYLDMDSLAKQFLIYRICMEEDQMWASTCFLKKAYDEKMVALAPYDVDRSYGAIDVVADCEASVEFGESIMGEFYGDLYKDDKYKATLVKCYIDLLPKLHELIDLSIDEYVSMIQASRKMDDVILSNIDEAGTWMYSDSDMQIRYVKSFLVNRLNYINHQWGIEDEFELADSTGTCHDVEIYDENGALVLSFQVIDGETLSFDTEVISRLFWKDKYIYGSRRKYYSWMPIYEDSRFVIY